MNLNKTETVELEEIKICHDGAIDKSGWTAETNMVSSKDSKAEIEGEDDDPETGSVNGNTLPEEGKISTIGDAIDNDASTVFYGTPASKNVRPYVILNLGKVEQVTAVKFTPAAEDYSGDASNTVAAGDLFKYRLFGYRIEVSLDGTEWTTVKEGNSYTGSATDPSSWKKQSDIIYNDDGSYTMFFNKMQEDGTLDPFMYIYDAQYVRITATNMSGFAVAELDVLGPTSDNVELISSGYGELTEDFVYSDGVDADGNEYKIPAGAIVFYGSYKGDPSYNVVELRDQNNVILGGKQIILADVPEKGMLGETSDGRWFFWFETEEEKAQLNDLTVVQAQLYRVDDALSLRGERRTSDSLHFTLPATRPQIRIESAATDIFQADPALSGGSHTASAPSYDASAEIEVASLKLTLKRGKIQFTSSLSGLSIAACTTINLSDITDEIAAEVTWSETDDGVFRTYRYNDGKLTVYTVAKRGMLYADDMSGNIALTNIPEDEKMSIKFTSTTMDQLDANYLMSQSTYLATATLLTNCTHENVTVFEEELSTCTTHGHGAYTACEDCGEVLSGSDEEYPLAEHNFTGFDRNGTYHWHKCVVCGAELDKAEHTFGEWTVTKEPTATEDGKKSRICTECGFQEVMPLAAGEDPSDSSSTPSGNNPSTLPDTSDSFNTTFWVVLAILSVAMIGVVSSCFRKRYEW